MVLETHSVLCANIGAKYQHEVPFADGFEQRHQLGVRMYATQRDGSDRTERHVQLDGHLQKRVPGAEWHHDGHRMRLRPQRFLVLGHPLRRNILSFRIPQELQDFFILPHQRAFQSFETYLIRTHKMLISGCVFLCSGASSGQRLCGRYRHRHHDVHGPYMRY